MNVISVNVFLVTSDVQDTVSESTVRSVCTVNPSVNGGEDYKKQKINKPCNVVVIGGGTAGLEAACTAAEVGCTTFLIEKKPELGGLAA